MSWIDRELVEHLKEEYPEGTRVELIDMSDPYRHIPSGTQGTVYHVDDIGTIHTHWDCGVSLGLIYGEDHFRKL